MAPRKSASCHPYLAGNFHPVSKETSLTPCEALGPQPLPSELAGGQYIRNGGNPAHVPQKGRAYHWFDGDGMLHGVYFARRRTKPPQQEGDDELLPMFVNKFVLTDVYLASVRRGASTLPSIATLISPSTSLPSLLATLVRATLVQLMSSISRLTVANTAVVFHDRRLLATCESGPCIEVRAPDLDTVDYHVFDDGEGHGLGKAPLTVGKGEVGWKMVGGMLEEWTTGHPKVDPITGELVFIGYNIFARPFLTHSVVAKDGTHVSLKQPIELPRPKMMHDFGATLTRSIILDLPLTMDPMNLLRGSATLGKTRPMVHFDRALLSRFGVVRRDFAGDQSSIRWFEAEPCMIFHTANSWDESRGEDVSAVNMLACRFLSAKLVHSAGGLAAPAIEQRVATDTQDVVRLTYYRFSLSSEDPFASPSIPVNRPTFETPLSAIPFEFSVVPHQRSMQPSKFIYGLSLVSGTFDSALEGARPDVIVKMDVETLISRAVSRGADHIAARKGGDNVDGRTVTDILDAQASRTARGQLGLEEQFADPIKLFRLPARHFASEPSFVPRRAGATEDDGYLLFYVFDESQLRADGSLPDDDDAVHSELWVIDAAKVGLGNELVSRVRLPRRVPYGLHSEWITEAMIASQRVDVSVRTGGNVKGQGDLQEVADLMDQTDRQASRGRLPRFGETGGEGMATFVWTVVLGLWAWIWTAQAPGALGTDMRQRTRGWKSVYSE